MIEIVGLVKRYGTDTAVNGLSFRVERGEVVGLLGPNGSGKTTTINVLSTLIAPDEGTVSVCGRDVVADPSGVRELISLTGQFAAVDDELTGRENLRLFGALRGLGRSAADERATELLGRFDLVAAGDQRVKAYSGGMRRRLDIAASLVVLPEVLFLDEPTTGLDPRSRSALWAVVRELRAGGMAIVLTTQYLEEADQLADRIVLIDHGRLIASGTPAELKGLIGGVSCVIEIVNPQDLDRAAMIIASVGEPHVDTEACTVSVAGVDGSLTMTTVLSSLEAAGIAIGDAGLKRPSLDDVYLTLTGQVTP